MSVFLDVRMGGHLSYYSQTSEGEQWQQESSWCIEMNSRFLKSSE